MGYFQALKRPDREAGQNTICCGVKEWVKQYFTLLHVFKALGAKYLNSKGFDCPTEDTQTRRGFKCSPIPRSRGPNRLKKAKLNLKNNQFLTQDKFGTPVVTPDEGRDTEVGYNGTNARGVKKIKRFCYPRAVRK